MCLSRFDTIRYDAGAAPEVPHKTVWRYADSHVRISTAAFRSAGALASRRTLQDVCETAVSSGSEALSSGSEAPMAAVVED